jgi:hypothetical protein
MMCESRLARGSGDYEIRVSASSREIRLRAGITAAPDAGAHVPDHRADAACYYDLSRGIDVPTARLPRCSSRNPRARAQKGEKHTMNVTLSEVQHTLLVGFWSPSAERLPSKRRYQRNRRRHCRPHSLHHTAQADEFGVRFFAAPNRSIVHFFNHAFIRGLKALFSKE